MQGQGDKADHFEPMVTLFQVGSFVGEDMSAHGLGQPHGDVDLRTDEAQNKCCFNPVAFPTAINTDGLPHQEP